MFHGANRKLLAWKLDFSSTLFASSQKEFYEKDENVTKS